MSIYIKNTSFKSPDQRVADLEKLNYYLSGTDQRKIAKCYANLDQRDRAPLANYLANSNPSNRPLSEKLSVLPERGQVINGMISALRNQVIRSPNAFEGARGIVEEGNQETVLSFLDPQSQIRMAQTTHFWRTNASVQGVQLVAEACLHHQSHLDDTHARLLNFPEDMIQFYRTRNSLRLARLPIADVSTGEVRKETMTSPVMRFNGAAFQPGIAMHVQPRGIPTKSTVIHIFKYHSRKDSETWALAGHLDIRNVFSLRHDPHCTSDTKLGPGWVLMCCPTCPAQAGRYRDLMTDEDLSGILANQDPDFEIASNSNSRSLEEKKN
ncbi:MAG: hypothetical protein V4487_02875 [Chlamydiota bacterium]